MNKYREMRERQQAEFDRFPLGFAFSQKQFDEMMEKWGLSPDDTDKICKIPYGGFVQKKDLQSFKDMCNRHREEEEEAIRLDSTGEGFVFDMFLYELDNHEYGYTGIYDETLDALGYSIEEVYQYDKLKRGFEKAVKTIRRDAIKRGW